MLCNAFCTSTLFSQQSCYLCRGTYIYKLDLDACNTTQIGNTGSVTLTDIALTPSGNLYGVDFYNFYNVSTANGALTLISTIDAFGAGFNSLVGYNDEYVLAVRITGGLYKIHTSTGDTTLIGMLGYPPAGDITFYKGSYYMADAMNQLIRFNLDFTNSIISDIEVVGTMNTLNETVYGIVTMGDVNCEEGDLRIIAFGGTTIYNVNPYNASCSIVCPSSSNIAASGAASPVETETQFPDSRIEMPNIFTPNNDGVNDYFEPSFIVGVSNLQIDIVNRWGNIVYSNYADDTFSWSGYASDGMCSDGVYFYKLVYSDYCNKQEIITGFIQLEK